MTSKDSLQEIRKTLSGKAILKQQIYDNTKSAFELLKKILMDITSEINESPELDDDRVKLKFSISGEFTVQLKVAGDLLVFTMHTNIFQFDRNHEIWKTKYIQDNVNAGFSGVISIYNFLSDSFKYNRMEDLGYLIARVFVNHENHFFVQGKRQSGFRYSTLGENTIDKKGLEDIIKAAIQYCLDFDLLVPPYDSVKLATVGQIHQSISDSKLKTGKRLGFQFNSDDID
jgi:hypothetical protein